MGNPSIFAQKSVNFSTSIHSKLKWVIEFLEEDIFSSCFEGNEKGREEKQG